MYKLDRVSIFWSERSGAAPNTMTVDRYLFRRFDRLMDAGGNDGPAPGPAIQDSVKAKKMNWHSRHPQQGRAQKGLIGNH